MIKHQVFFSFHFDHNAWRASQVRNMGKVDDSSTFSDNDWEKVRNESELSIKRWINSQLQMRSCLVVLVGAHTSERKWVNYEIKKAMELHKGIVGIRINKLKNALRQQDLEGANPFFYILTKDSHRLSNYVTLFDSAYSSSDYVYSDISNHIGNLIEEAITRRFDF